MPLHDSFQRKAKPSVLKLSAVPSAEDLAYGLSVAHENQRKPYLIAWQAGIETRFLAITCGLQPGSDEATWILKDGESPSARLLWKHSSLDAYMIHTLLSDELGTVSPAAVIPDFLKRVEPQPQLDWGGAQWEDLPKDKSPAGVESGAKPARTVNYEDEAVGAVFDDRYELLAEVGRGAMGIVYKAHQRIINRHVAIKILHAHLLGESNWKRLEQEARAASALSHPNLIVIHDFGTSPLGRPYIVMDFAEGKNLQDILNETGTIDPRLFVEVLAQCCAAVGHAHKKGIVHRDMKPANINLTEADGAIAIKILDFGIAKARDNGDQSLTRAGIVLGSPLYMSPEQCRNEDLDGRSDIYSIGVMMYQCLTGSMPFVGQDSFETLYMHINNPPAPFAKVCPSFNIPPAVERIVFKALEKDLSMRYQTAERMEEDIRALGNLKWSKQVTTAQKECQPRQSQQVQQMQADPQSVNAALLLQQAGLITTQDIDHAQSVVAEVGGDPAAILVATGKLDRNMLDAARKCKAAIERKRMNLSQSCLVLNYCFRARCNFEDAWQELGL